MVKKSKSKYVPFHVRTDVRDRVKIAAIEDRVKLQDLVTNVLRGWLSRRSAK
jgi:hypothetical protein